MKLVVRSARATVAVFLLSALCSQPAGAWGRDGHMIINRLAAQYLPSDTPAFLRNGAALDIMEYLGPEPDRWKDRAEQELSDTQSPDHFLDLEYADLAGIPCSAGPTACDANGKTFPKRRYDFIRALTVAQAKHPNLPLNEKVGFQPWQVEEVWQRLKADMREYRHLVAANQDTRPDEVAILFDAGWLGHYVGDGSQPLHVTIQYNGWTGPNPDGFATDHKIHSKFESVFVTAAVHRDTDVAPLIAATKPTLINDEWNQYLAFLFHTNALVATTYQLDKQHGFDGAGTPQGKAFVNERLAAGAIELRDLIYSAWIHSNDPVQPYNGPQ